MSAPFYVCRLMSRHFEFEAYGATADDAKAAFASGIVEHCRLTGADFPTWGVDMLAEVVPFGPVHLGDCYRDGSLLEGRR